MILSNTCNYGIRAALYIAMNEDRKYVPIKEISEKLNISFHFLTKILQKLTQQNIMVSFRGPNGGVALAKPTSEISLLDIVYTIDGSQLFENCLLGLNQCDDSKPCPLHHKWAAVREKLYQAFLDTSLQEMANKIKQDNLRLTDLIPEKQSV